MKSVGQMIQQCAGLIDTPDVTDWENQFLQDMVEKTDEGSRTSHLSPRQVDCLDRIYRKHFV